MYQIKKKHYYPFKKKVMTYWFASLPRDLILATASTVASDLNKYNTERFYVFTTKFLANTFSNFKAEEYIFNADFLSKIGLIFACIYVDRNMVIQDENNQDTSEETMKHIIFDIARITLRLTMYPTLPEHDRKKIETMEDGKKLPLFRHFVEKYFENASDAFAHKNIGKILNENFNTFSFVIENSNE